MQQKNDHFSPLPLKSKKKRMKPLNFWSIYGFLIHVYMWQLWGCIRGKGRMIRALVDLAHFSRLIGINPRESFPFLSFFFLSSSFFLLFGLFFHKPCLILEKVDTPVRFSDRIHKHCVESLTPQVEDETGKKGLQNITSMGKLLST